MVGQQSRQETTSGEKMQHNLPQRRSSPRNKGKGKEPCLHLVPPQGQNLHLTPRPDKRSSTDGLELDQEGSSMSFVPKYCVKTCCYLDGATMGTSASMHTVLINK